MLPGDAWISGVRGWSGTTRGVVRVSRSDVGPVPTAFTALTVTKYSAPGERPSMAHARAPVVVHVAPPGTAVAV